MKEETGFNYVKQLNEDIEERRFVSLNDAIVRAGKDPVDLGKKRPDKQKTTLKDMLAAQGA